MKSAKFHIYILSAKKLPLCSVCKFVAELAVVLYFCIVPGIKL